jgi:hypothetical protein
MANMTVTRDRFPLELIGAYGLAPSQASSISVGNVVYKLGKPFNLDHDRVGVLFYFERDGKTYVRAAYRSNSDGLFRVLPGISRFPFPKYDKAAGEESLTLPFEIQENLAKAVIQGEENLRKHPSGESRIVPPEIGSRILEHSVRFVPDAFQDYLRKVSERFKTDEVVKPISAGASNTILAGDSRVPRPEDVTFQNPNLAPDFSNETGRFVGRSSLVGTFDVFRYLSKDKSIEYSICREKATSTTSKVQMWFCGATLPNSPFNELGVREKYVELGPLAIPLWEYGKQSVVGFTGAQHPVHGEYFLSWPYLCRVPIVREWYFQTGRKGQFDCPTGH